MARDPLRALLLLRQRSVEQARQALGVCLAVEVEAAGRITSLDETMRRDRAASGVAQDMLPFGEMFAMRRDTAQADRRTAMSALAAAELRSAESRRDVAEARTAAESVQRLVEERDAARDAESSRQEQHALDDIARSRPRVAAMRCTPATQER